MSRYLLVPVDGFDKKNREITIADGLVDSYGDLYNHVSDKDKLKNLLLQLSDAKLGCNEDGLMKHDNRILDGIIFKDVIVDMCNGHYKHCYESFYKILLDYGIVF